MVRMKVDRHGQAKILTNEEIDLVFNEGLTNDRDRAIFALCLYTACRIKECVTLRTTDVYYRQGIVRPEIVFRKGNTKGKLATRCIPVIEDLRRMLLNYYPSPRTWFYFPGLGKTGHLHSDSAGRILRKACNKVGVQGVSTHSFRRTALTLMSNEGIPLRIIQPTFSSPTDEIQKKSPKNRNLILKKKVNLINGRLVRGLFTLTNCYKVSNSQESMINENYHPNQINLPSVAQ